MMDLEEYNRFKKDLDRMHREADKSQGAFDQVMKRISTDHKCESIKAAEDKIQKLTKQESQLLEEIEEEREKLKNTEGWKRLTETTNERN